MAEWREDEAMKRLAVQVIAKREEVAHVDINEVLFLRELETKPKALARCYSFNEHPIGLFTDKPFGIVFYWQNCFYMSPEQLAIMMWHELMHIPLIGYKLVQHDVKDFRQVLRIDLCWTDPGREVPDILG